MNAEIPPGLADGIDPGAIEIPKVKVEDLEEAARAIKGDGQDVADTGNNITSSWGGLEGIYSAPEAETLFSAIDPVATKGDEFDGAAQTAGDALLVFAEDVRPILQRWRGLKADAQDMQDHIAANEEWDKDEDKVEEFNQLNNDLIKVQNDFMAAERECANKITALFGGTTFIATDPGSQPNTGKGEKAYGYSEAPEDVATPWAIPQEHDAAWYVDVGSALKDLTWGSVVDTAGMIGLNDGEGDWTLNPATMWDNASATWSETFAGMGMLAGYGPDGFSWSTAGTAWKEVAHSMVPWREWGDRPGYVITQGIVNIGSIVGGAALSFTGVGAAVGVPLMAWRGTRVMRTVSNLGDLAPGPGSGSHGGGDSASGSPGSGNRFDLNLNLDGAGQRNGIPTTKEIQDELGAWEDLAADIGWEETLRRAGDLSEMAQQRQPALVGSGGPDIQLNADGPNDPPSTGPKPNPPDSVPDQDRPSNPTPNPNPSGEGGSPSGGNPPNGGGGGGGRPPLPDGDGGGDDGDRGGEEAPKPTGHSTHESSAPGEGTPEGETPPDKPSTPTEAAPDPPPDPQGESDGESLRGDAPVSPIDPVGLGEDPEWGTGRPSDVNRNLEQLQGPGALGDDFKRDVVEDPATPFDKVDERPIADLRSEKGYHVTGLDESHGSNKISRLDAWERANPSDPGTPVEYKNIRGHTVESMMGQLQSALKKLRPEKFPFEQQADIVVGATDTLNTSDSITALEGRLNQDLQRNSPKLQNLRKIDIYTMDNEKVTYIDRKIYLNGTLVREWDGSWQPPQTSS